MAAGLATGWQLGWSLESQLGWQLGWRPVRWLETEVWRPRWRPRGLAAVAIVRRGCDSDQVSVKTVHSQQQEERIRLLVQEIPSRIKAE